MPTGSFFLTGRHFTDERTSNRGGDIAMGRGWRDLPEMDFDLRRRTKDCRRSPAGRPGGVGFVGPVRRRVACNLRLCETLGALQ